MTEIHVHDVLKLCMTQTQFKEPFSFHTTRFLCETGEGEMVIVLYTKEKLTIEKAK